MEIYPALQFKLLVAAFLSGVLGGLFWELLTALRVLLGAYCPPARDLALYHRPLPLLPQGVPPPQQKKRRIWRISVVFVTDLLFCVLFAATLVLLLYEYNDGAWRLSVPVLALAGLAAFRLSLARPLARLSALTAYLLAAVMAYARVLARLFRRTLARVFAACVLRPLRALLGRWRRRLWQQKSNALCRMQLNMAKEGLAPHLSGKEKKHVKRKKEQAAPAMGDRSFDRDHFFRGSFHFRQSADGVEPAAKRKRGAGAAKRGA